MKKTSRFALFALSSLMMTGSFYACNDYDGDINSLNDRIDGIVNGSTDVTSSQTLLAELAKLKQELLEEVASKYATVAALSNYATKAELESALAKAKTELIAEINKCTTMDAVKSYISGLGYLTETQINNLLQAYATPREISEALKSYSTTTEVNALIAGCEKKGDIQAALKDYSKTTEISALMTAYAKKSDIESSVEEAKSDLLKKIQTYTDMESVKTYVSSLNYMSKAEINALLSSYTTPADIAKDLADYCKTTEVDAKIAEQAKTLTDAQTELIQTLIDNNLNDYETVAKFNISIATVKGSLNARIDSASAANLKVMKDSLADHQVRIASLESTVRGFEKNMSDAADAAVSKALKSFVGEYTGTLSDVDKNIKDLTKRVESLTLAVDQLLKRIQSIVFVPEFGNQWSGDTYVPVYKNTYSAAVDPQSILKFRVSPAESAEAIVKLFEAHPEFISLDVQNAIKTRSAISIPSIAKIEAISGGIINVYSTIPDDNLSNNSLYPASLVITNDNDTANHISTGYFNLRVQNYSSLILNLFNSSAISSNKNYLGISYLKGESSISSVKVYDTDEEISIANGYSYNPQLKVFGGYEVAAGGAEALKWVKKNNSSAEWTSFKAYAETKGFVVDENGIVKAISPSNVANVGNTIKLRVYDENFGFNSTTKLPNVAYDLICKITTGDIVDPLYDFGKAQLTWGSSRTVNGVTTTYCDNAFTVYSDQTKAVHFENHDIVVNALLNDMRIEAANDVQVIAELQSLTPVVTVKDVNNISYSGFSATVGFNATDKKANLQIAVPANTKYQKYYVTITYTTQWGKVSFKALLDLSNPTDLFQHNSVFENGNLNVLYGSQVGTNYVDGKQQCNLFNAYYYYAKYKELGLNYVFSVKKIKVGNAEYVVNGISINNTTGVLKVDSKPYYTKDGKDYLCDAKIKCSLQYADGTEISSEEFGLNIKYPIADDAFTNTNSDVQQSLLANGNEVPVIKNVNLKDIYGNQLYKEGAPVNVGTTTAPIWTKDAWNITGLTYEFVNAVSVSGIPNTGIIVTNDGKIKKDAQNLAEDVIVTVKVSTVGYTYNPQISGTFKVTIKK